MMTEFAPRPDGFNFDPDTRKRINNRIAAMREKDPELAKKFDKLKPDQQLALIIGRVDQLEARLRDLPTDLESR